MARRKKDKMLELIESDNSIIKAIRDENWIYNPKVYAQIAGDFSLMHQRVLLGILEKLQDRIIHSANSHKADGEGWLPLFGKDELNENIDFEIDPRELGVSHEHYGELAQALKDLSTMRIGFPQKKGRKVVYVFATLFSRIEMPFGEKYRTGKIRIKMDKENVNDFLSMDRGYTDHVAKIAQIAKKQRTPRLYIYLSTFRYKGHEKVKYPELTEFLGIDDQSYIESHKADNPKVSPTDNPFHKFSKVKKLILEPSREEMDKLCVERKIDFTFTYTPLYEDGRKKGNPTHIEFVIVLGYLGQQHEHDRMRHNKIQKLIDSLFSWCPDLKGYDVPALASAVDDDFLDDFLSWAYGDMRAMVRKQQPDDVAAYAMSLMNKYVDNLIEKKEKQRRQSLREDVTQLLALKPGQVYVESYDKSKNELLLNVRTSAIYEALESNEYISRWQQIVNKYYPHPRVKYRVLKK